jgi:hypothetical protein
VSNQVVLNEAQALEKLAGEVWTRLGKSFVTKHGFTAEAILQVLEPLTPEVRDGLKLRIQPHPRVDAGAKQFIMDARSAEKLLSKHGLTLNEVQTTAVNGLNS